MPAIRSLAGFTTDNYLRTAPGLLPGGPETFHCVLFLAAHTIPQGEPSDGFTIVGSLDSNAGIYTNFNFNQFSYTIGDGSGLWTGSYHYAHTPLLQQRWLPVLFYTNSAGNLECWIAAQKTQLTAGDNAAPETAGRTLYGAFPAFGPETAPNALRWAGAGYGEGSITRAAIGAWVEACRASGGLDLSALPFTNGWRAPATVGASVSPAVGADSLEVVGSLSVETLTAPW